MFNKGNKDSSSPDTGAFSAAPKRTAMKSKAPSILSGDLVLTGTIVSDGEIQLDGTVEGDVRAGSLIIGEDATVSGEVQAETVVIRGRVSGSVPRSPGSTGVDGSHRGRYRPRCPVGGKRRLL